jgi:phospholipid/cholesterol/gamma-HCH transport system substrate-binding protein
VSTRPVHHDVAKKVVVGVVMILALLVVGWIGGIVQTGGALPGKNYTYVTAEFDDVGILKTGKDVKQDGLRVGTVSKIEYVDGLAVVTLRIDGDVEVHRDATAFVGNTSALGKKYVGFDPGTPEAGDLGDEPIAVEATRGSTSLEDVLSALDPKTRTALQKAVGALGVGTAGHSEDLNAVLAASPELLTDLETVMEAAGGDRADIASLLISADDLVNRFNGRTGEIEALVKNVDRTVQALGVDDGRPLEETVAGLPSALRTADKALEDLHDPLVDAEVALRDLQPGARALGAATPDLRAFLRDSPDTLDKVPGVADDAVPAVSSLTDTLQDARPLLDPLKSSVDSLAHLLYRFAPYSGDAARFFSQHDLLSGILDGDDSKHYFAAQLTGVGLFSVAGLPDPLYRSEFYPCPGTAWDHATVTDCSAGAN